MNIHSQEMPRQTLWRCTGAAALAVVLDCGGSNEMAPSAPGSELQDAAVGAAEDAGAGAEVDALGGGGIDAAMPPPVGADGTPTRDTCTAAFGNALTAATPAAVLATKLEQALSPVNHISVYATGYGPTGAHKVHRNGNGSDGALVLEPTSASPHVLAFHFSNQSF